MEALLLRLTLLFYSIATAGFVTDILLSNRSVARRIAMGTLAAAILSHGTAVVLHGGVSGILSPASAHEQLSMLGWAVVATYVVLQYWYPMNVVGALVAPCALLLTLSAYLVYTGERIPGEQSAWLPAHVVPAFLGYAVFTLAFCISVIYLIEERQLKSRRPPRLLRRVPSLERLDSLNHRFVTWGFALFTIGIITGSVLAKARWGTFWAWEPVQVLSLVTWVLYAVLLHMRSLGWRGRRAATLTVVGFALMITSFAGLNLGGHDGTMGKPAARRVPTTPRAASPRTVLRLPSSVFCLLSSDFLDSHTYLSSRSEHSPPHHDAA